MFKKLRYLTDQFQQFCNDDRILYLLDDDKIFCWEKTRENYNYKLNINPQPYILFQKCLSLEKLLK